ncbi:hypothetical protein BH23ACT12_BH23ACT12_13440 [soil metagenome]
MLPARFFRVALPVLCAGLAACGGSTGGGRVDLTAREYAFQGLPATVDPGDVTFSIDNQGSEVHELHLFKLEEDVNAFSELVDKSQDEAQDQMSSVGMAVADPGDTESFDAELSAGRYAAVCLIPVGTIPEDGHSDRDMQVMEDTVFDPNADTHMRRGMFAEFTVG